jgi:iron complex transport system substrate-binding protein
MMGEMKIVSLLPSATEIAFALGLGDQLQGRSFECDHPPEAARVPIVSGTALTTNGSGDATAIDSEVSSLVAQGESIYVLDEERIRSIAPDLILAQDLCRVCAVPSGEVEQALETIGCTSEVVSLDPERLDEVIDGIGQVGEVTGRRDEASALMAGLRERVDAVTSRVADRTRVRVLVVEWADPPFNAGHWVPDMIEAAGGDSLLAAPGGRSRRLAWEEIRSCDPEVVVFAPCGFDLDGAVAQSGPLLDRPELAGAERFYAVDANAHYSRPGPRVVDGVEVLAELLHGDDSSVTTWARRLR